MSDDTLKIRRKISTLASSLDDLETSLTALSSQSLPDLVIGLDTIQQAKLQVVIPYLAYDLVFSPSYFSLYAVLPKGMCYSLLKTRGLDPKTHPVIAELDRVRQYFDKIKDAEILLNLAIDKAAATRFIKNAIAQAKDTIPTKTVSGPAAAHIRSSDEDGKAPPHVVRVPMKQTEKMLEREKYHEALREEALQASEGDGDEHLEVIDNDDDDEENEGKANAVGSPIPDVLPPSPIAAGKRRRAPIDPFAGYGERPDTRSLAASAETDSTPSALRSGTKMRRIHKEDVSAEASSSTNTPSGGEHQDEVKIQGNDPEKRESHDC
ncbi:hypothetical protein BJV77DRAFT_1063138 [Russula vinacea]|nr:hypothetical protein BJV77DRAFT_1063138 [Russula vinacea]